MHLCDAWLALDVRSPLDEPLSITPITSWFPLWRDTNSWTLLGVFGECLLCMHLHDPSKNAKQFPCRQPGGVAWGTFGVAGRACIIMLREQLVSKFGFAHFCKQARFILLFCVLCAALCMLDVQRWSSHQIVIARHKAISKFKCFDTWSSDAIFSVAGSHLASTRI